MTRPISPDEALSHYGVAARHETMDNGEVRFRLLDREGNGYVLTLAGHQGAWQKSHFHKRQVETYVVERGWMALATPADDYARLDVSIVGERQIISTPLNKSHNVYLPSGAVIHTVKHGGAGEAADWHGDERLDHMTRGLNEAAIIELSKGGPR